MENRNTKYLCEHNKRKYQCKECGGSQICPHKKRKSNCTECGGSQICPHNRLKYQCKDCGGIKICRHNRQKNYCKDCGGTQICPHNRQKAHCKECKGSQICAHNRQKSHCKGCSDPIKVNIKQWIFSRRQYDNMHNIYDADRFIDECFLKGLIEDYHQCYYGDCKVNLQYTEYRNDLATIERLDNSIGHIKSNCVMCCLKCNLLKKSNKVT